MELWVVKNRKVNKSEPLIRFIRVEQLDYYLEQGWRVLKMGTEIATIYWK